MPLGVRILRRLLVLAVLLGGLFVGANIVIENIAEGALATGAQRAFELPARPEVDIKGFPILLRLLSGEVPRVSLRASAVPLGDRLTARTVTIEMEALDASNVLSGDDLRFTVGRGHALAEVTEDALNDFLRESGEDVRVSLLDGSVRGRASAVIGGRKRTIRARGALRLRRGEISFTPRSVTVDGEEPPSTVEERARREASFRLRLPELPGGAAVAALQVKEDLLRLSADLAGFRFPPE